MLQANKPSFTTSKKVGLARPFSELNPGSRASKARQAKAQGHTQEVDPQGHLLVPAFGASQNPNYQTQVAIRDADNIEASYGGVSQLSGLSRRDQELH